MNLKEFFARDDRRYALSTVRGTLNTYHHWLRKGYSEKHSMDNAIKYAMGQIQSIVARDALRASVSDFQLMGQISQTVADLLQSELNKKGNSASRGS